MSSNTKKYLYCILKAQATAIAVANISCSIHSIHQGHTHAPDVSSESGSTNVTTNEVEANGTNFSGAIAVLVTNMLLTIGILAQIDLFLYIWLFVYGSFWLVFIFVAPEAYQKLPGISHYLAKIISEHYHLDQSDRPKIYTCLKLISCLIILLLLYVRTKTVPIIERKETFNVGTQISNKSKRYSRSKKKKVSLDYPALSERAVICSLHKKQPCYDSTSTFKRNVMNISSLTNTSMSASTDTLVDDLTSTPSCTSATRAHANKFKPNEVQNPQQLNESEECSFDILQSRVEN